MGFGIGSVFKGVTDILTSPFTALMPKKPKYPVLPPEKPMPVGDEAEKRKARRRAIAAQRARSGRASTILSQRETLG